MPAKKIDTDDKKLEEKRQSVKLKLLFFGIFVMALFVTNLYVEHMRKDVQEAVAELERGSRLQENGKEAVLGETTEDERERLARVQSKTQELADSFFNTSETLITDSKDRFEKTVSEFVYTSTIKPIIDKINGLPNDQQEYIRDAICVPPEE